MSRSSRMRASSGVAHGTGSTRCATRTISIIRLRFSADVKYDRTRWRSDVVDVPTYRTSSPGPAEQVDAGAVRQPVGEGALAAHVLRDGVRRGGEVLQVRDAERREPRQEGVQHVDGRLRVRQRPVVGRHGGVEQVGEGRELVVRRLVAGDDASGEPDRVHHLVAGPRVAGPRRGGLEEADVERGVVRDEHGAAGELEEAGQHLLDRRGADQHRGGDPGQHLDERRHRAAGVHERLELAEDLAAAHLDRPDLGDRAVRGGAAGGLQVDDDERDVRQRRPDVLQAELDRAPGRVGGGVRPDGAQAADGRHGADATHGHRHDRDPHAVRRGRRAGSRSGVPGR